jgi:hypothetical protein
MYRKFDVTENLFLHSALFNDLNTAKDEKWGWFSSQKIWQNAIVAISLLYLTISIQSWSN